MSEERDKVFRDAERVLLNLALLLILLIGLYRVIAPDVRQIVGELFDDDRPAAAETRSDASGPAEEHGTLVGGR